MHSVKWNTGRETLKFSCLRSTLSGTLEWINKQILPIYDEVRTHTQQNSVRGMHYMKAFQNSYKSETLAASFILPHKFTDSKLSSGLKTGLFQNAFSKPVLICRDGTKE